MRRLAVVCAVGLALRIAYVLAVTRHQVPSTSMLQHGVLRSYDETYYVRAAEAVADGDWFRFGLFGPPAEQAAHPPLTSLVLAPLSLLGAGELTMRLVTAVGGAATVAVLGLTGRRVGGPRVGLIAAGLAAVYANLWMNDGLIMAETWTALATALVVLGSLAMVRDPSPRRAALVGAGCGLAALTRSELALLVPLLGLVMAASPHVGQLRARMRAAALVTLSAAVVTAPWVGYNLSRFDEPVLLSHADGDVLVGANCEPTYYGDRLGLHDGRCGLGIGDDSLDHSVNARLRRDAALRYARDHAGRLPVVVAARLGRTWSVFAPVQMADFNRAEGRPMWASLLGLAMYWPMVAAAVLGIARLRHRRETLLPILIPVVVVTVNAMLFFGFVRHRVPAEVSLVLLAAVGIDRVLRSGRRDTVAGPATEDRPAATPVPAEV